MAHDGSCVNAPAQSPAAMKTKARRFTVGSAGGGAAPSAHGGVKPRSVMGRWSSDSSAAWCSGCGDGGESDSQRRTMRAVTDTRGPIDRPARVKASARAWCDRSQRPFHVINVLPVLVFYTAAVAFISVALRHLPHAD